MEDLTRLLEKPARKPRNPVQTRIAEIRLVTARSSTRSGRVPKCHLASRPGGRHPGRVEEEQGIYRGEVTSIMVALADIYADTGRILVLLGDEEDDDEEEEKDS